MRVKLKSDFKWICFVARRISRINRKGRTAAASYLAALGIALGVMALIVIMSVMNGFQMGFIDSIMEISSYHIGAVKIKKFFVQFLFMKHKVLWLEIQKDNAPRLSGQFQKILWKLILDLKTS